MTLYQNFTAPVRIKLGIVDFFYPSKKFAENTVEVSEPGTNTHRILFTPEPEYEVTKLATRAYYSEGVEWVQASYYDFSIRVIRSPEFMGVYDIQYPADARIYDNLSINVTILAKGFNQTATRIIILNDDTNKTIGRSEIRYVDKGYHNFSINPAAPWEPTFWSLRIIPQYWGDHELKPTEDVSDSRWKNGTDLGCGISFHLHRSYEGGTFDVVNITAEPREVKVDEELTLSVNLSYQFKVETETQLKIYTNAGGPFSSRSLKGMLSGSSYIIYDGIQLRAPAGISIWSLTAIPFYWNGLKWVEGKNMTVNVNVISK